MPALRWCPAENDRLSLEINSNQIVSNLENDKTLLGFDRKIELKIS